jgi:hypothetical protein
LQSWFVSGALQQQEFSAASTSSSMAAVRLVAVNAVALLAQLLCMLIAMFVQRRQQ